MNSYALLIEYDGTDYVGWQRQSNGPSVQALIEDAATKTFDAPVTSMGSGRTDAGVHARGQVAHVRYQGGNIIPDDKIAVALNTRLPRDVRVRGVARVSADFHARYSAEFREYIYFIGSEPRVLDRRHTWVPTPPYDPQLLVQSARVFLGDHDFTTFSKRNPSVTSYLCSVSICQVETNADFLSIRIRSNRFVYAMCRCIIGAMMEVARGNISIEEVQARLSARDRNAQSPLAPAHALVLNRVIYPDGLFDDYTCY